MMEHGDEARNPFWIVIHAVQRVPNILVVLRVPSGVYNSLPSQTQFTRAPLGRQQSEVAPAFYVKAVSFDGGMRCAAARDDVMRLGQTG